MVDHVSISVSSFERSRAFYKAILEPLGIKPLLDFSGVTAFGREDGKIPQFWMSQGGTPSRGGHIAFQAPSRDAVRRFHEAGLKAGGQNEGSPGLRPQYHENYYAAFLTDPDGYKVEAVLHSPE